MIKIFCGNIVHAPKFGELEIIEHGYIALKDGVIAYIGQEMPTDWAVYEFNYFYDRLIMPSFCTPFPSSENAQTLSDIASMSASLSPFSPTVIAP